MKKNYISLILSLFIMTVLYSAQTMAADNPYIIKRTGGEIHITRSADLTGTLSQTTVEIKNGVSGKYDSGPISDLKVKDPNKEFQFEKADNIIIETADSPGCTWYFVNGRYYRVCD